MKKKNKISEIRAKVHCADSICIPENKCGEGGEIWQCVRHEVKKEEGAREFK